MMEKTAELPLHEHVFAIPAGTVSFKAGQAQEVQGSLLRLTPLVVVFEVYGPEGILRTSEVLGEFKIRSDEQVFYEGRATLTSVINTGTAVICEATLTGALLNFDVLAAPPDACGVKASFEAFAAQWHKSYKVQQEFKLAIADMRSFLSELRLWLEQIEAGLSALGADERQEAEALVLREPVAREAMKALFEQFDQAASAVPEELAPAHRRFCRQQLHSLLLLAPFSHRIFTKPLGYAGDYEMIDMIIRNRPEGRSLFAKLVHTFILDLAAARSVRNRAGFFAAKFVEETGRVWLKGRTARIYTLGCGPAREVQQFMAESFLSDKAEFRLLDFNQETLDFAGGRLAEVKRQHQRGTQVELVKRSVYTLLKGPDPDERFDMIYCSGLYDYLNDRVCRALNTYLYEQLAPGGTLIVTNFDTSNPIRNLMEYVFEWFLIHRNAAQMARLAPEQAAADDCTVFADSTGCNIFLQARKPPASS